MAFTSDGLAGAHSCSLLILVMCLVLVTAVTTPSHDLPSVNPRATSTSKPVEISFRYSYNKVAEEDLENIRDFRMLGFFLESKIVKGSTMDLGTNFLYDAANSRKDFLSGAVADTLPALKASNLPKLLQAFNIGEGTEMARSMEKTISIAKELQI
ncbi:unnamed protein product [Sphagnum troendelagicum]|uniref:BURP domain-containing protein n=1 Tax=Sphagnum troendelagicum TaxID=128251 RepID=A0ABP0V2B9_9BRYO